MKTQLRKSSTRMVTRDIFFRNKKLGEIDFLVQYPHWVLPIEVKSGKTYKCHSTLTKLLSTENYDIDQAVVLCESNVECSSVMCGDTIV